MVRFMVEFDHLAGQERLFCGIHFTKEKEVLPHRLDRDLQCLR